MRVNLLFTSFSNQFHATINLYSKTVATAKLFNFSYPAIGAIFRTGRYADGVGTTLYGIQPNYFCCAYRRSCYVDNILYQTNYNYPSVKWSCTWRRYRF